MRRLLTLISALLVAGFATSAGAQPGPCGGTVATCPVSTDTTWSGTIIVPNVCFVNNGATLTISPGTIVRGQPRQAAPQQGVTTGVPGALVVTQSGRINAQGTATNPIIFTTAAVDNNGDNNPDDVDGNPGFLDPWTSPSDICLDDDPLDAPLTPLLPNGNGTYGLWGAVVILGNAPTNLQNKCGTGWGTCTIEGLTFPGFPAADALYGGEDCHDNSGVMRYVSIRHGGDEIGESNELNCLSLGGVGDGTVIEDVECYVNFDDGFEWFGGTVDSKRLVSWMIGDDTFDVDQGFSGWNQFWFGIMPFFNETDGSNFGSRSGDKGGEWDGDDFAERGQDVNVRRGTNPDADDNQPWPISQVAVWNMTMVGSTPTDTVATPNFPQNNSNNRGIQMRNGFAGRIFNSVISNTGTANALECIIGDGNLPGFGCPDYAVAGLVSVMCTTVDGIVPVDALGPPPTSAARTALANGDGLIAPLDCPSTARNVTQYAAAPYNVSAWNDYEQPDYTFDPQGNATGGKLDASLMFSGPMDPRLAFGLTGLAGCCPPFGPCADTSAVYRGAFDRAAPALWTTGWTAMNRGGIVAN